MKNRSCGNICKNAIGTMLLLAGAFFVCSTLVSMRAVLADPIAPAQNTQNNQNAMSPRSGRASPRGTSTSKTTARPTSNVATANRAAPSRGVATRNIAPRANVKVVPANTTPARSVVARTTATPATRANTKTRGVRARVTDTSRARVSLSGDAIQGIRGTKTGGSTYYTYLSNKLYTGNYSNIIDSTTGLISADAYSTCLESYYTCMDEICTARNAAKRRCSCAARVKNFMDAEEKLKTANEELIKASGELALLIANKGKDVTSAFTLTEAEQVMNCVSYQEVVDKYGSSSDEMQAWCINHMQLPYGTSNKTCSAPSYCESNDYGFNFTDYKKVQGSASDILASLQAWADAKTETLTLTDDKTGDLLASYNAISGVVSRLNGGIDYSNTESTVDELAKTWGYDLFEYAHNNVCGRVLDSCFNGIYEACGTPPSGTDSKGNKIGRCANGASSSCPYNYNSMISVTSDGDIKLNDRTNSTNASASCFGYTSTSGDPYSSLRGPVADARRSVMQKYLLDANADCDAFGEELKATAQNISYQKVAAQQALQQKRLEFYNEEKEQVLSDAIAAGTNFNECISELWDCYETQASSNSSWPTARIKTYCAQVANSPHCYQDMICNPSTAMFKAIIDKNDSNSCYNSQNYETNTCRNVVTLNEILNGASTSAVGIEPDAYGDSAKMREKCLRDNGIEEIRAWQVNSVGQTRCTLTQVRAADPNGRAGYMQGDRCVLTECNTNYTLSCSSTACTCTMHTTDCTSEIPHATSAKRTLNAGSWGSCTLESCETNYHVAGNSCEPDSIACSSTDLTVLHALSGARVWNGVSWGDCTISECAPGYTLNSDRTECVQ